jgi:hypothetical protein
MRGSAAPNGATNVSKNGYHYTKVDGKWRLTHHILAEKVLGRPLEEDERVSFANGKKHDLREANLVIAKRGTSSLRRRKAQLEARIQELQAELHHIEELISKDK